MTTDTGPGGDRRPVSSASPCCAASMPAPARSARSCSRLDGTVGGPRRRADADAGARARPRRARRGGAVAAALAVLRRVVAAGARPEGASAASPSPASARPACCWPRTARPLAPIIAWYDTRTTRRARLAPGARSASSALHRITGLCADPTFSLLKLLWHRRQQPELFARARGLAERRRLPRLAAVRRAGDRPQPRLAHAAARPRAARLVDALLDAAGLPTGLLPPMLPERQPDRHGPARGCGRDRPAGGLRRRRRRARPCLRPDRRRRRRAGRAARQPGHGRGADPGARRAARPTRRSAGTASTRAPSTRGRPLYYVFGGLPTAAASVEWFRGLHGGVDHATLIAEAEAAAAAGGERPVPAASAPGLAALPRPDRPRRLPGPLVGAPAAAPCSAPCSRASRSTAATCSRVMLRHLARRARPSGSSRSAAARATSS